ADLVIDLFREDFFATSLADRELQLRHRERINAPIMANFGIVAHSGHDDFLFAAMTATPRERPFGARWRLRFFYVISVHGYSQQKWSAGRATRFGVARRRQAGWELSTSHPSST